MSSPARSRRHLLLLLAALAALVGLHWAYRNPSTTAPGAGRPAVAITMRGQVTRADPGQLTINLEDPHGVLTGILRRVTVTSATRIRAGGASGTAADASVPRIQPGYRVTVRGYTDGSTVVARTITVYLPPVEGVVTAVEPGMLAIRVPGRREPVRVTLTSGTSYFLGQGTALAIRPGTVVRVLVRPGSAGTLVATSVVVNPGGSGS
ncbi:MAG: DUF5666 domain-containing protein [Actinomycetia bacterium]|nr:DUF5666 domain-containing protein [Actinomycetes bacterium]